MFEEIFRFTRESGRNWEIYSPYRFLTAIKDENILNGYFYSKIRDLSENEGTIVFNTEIKGSQYYFIVTPLKWDTRYFGFQHFRVDYILYENPGIEGLNQAVNEFCQFTSKFRDSYFFIDVPAEDIPLVQSLGNSPFRLIETRLNYILRDLKIEDQCVYPVRKARFGDIPYLRDVAVRSANPYDRVHADNTYSAQQSDSYIASFIENSVKGFANVVLVPDIESMPPFAFLAFNNPVDVENFRVGKLVLAASDSSVEKGWLYKLLVEAIRMLRTGGATHLSTITQVSNLPAIKSWEKTGFDYGFCTHIFSFKTR